MAMQQMPQLRQIEMRREQILATEIENRAVLGFAGPVAIGFDYAHVFALEAVADGCPHNSQKHDRGGSESGGIVPSNVKTIIERCNINSTSASISLSLQQNENQKPITAISMS
jgi:hypothetical protein